MWRRKGEKGMRVCVGEQEKNFEPVEIKIIIENEVDLAYIWGVSNVCHSDLVETNLRYQQHMRDIINENNTENPIMSLFRAVDKIATEKGLKN